MAQASCNQAGQEKEVVEVVKEPKGSATKVCGYFKVHGWEPVGEDGARAGYDTEFKESTVMCMSQSSEFYDREVFNYVLLNAVMCGVVGGDEHFCCQGRPLEVYNPSPNALSSRYAAYVTTPDQCYSLQTLWSTRGWRSLTQGDLRASQALSDMACEGGGTLRALYRILAIGASVPWHNWWRASEGSELKACEVGADGTMQISALPHGARMHPISGVFEH